MRVLIISQHFYPENFRINDIVFELSKYIEVEVLTGKPNYHTGFVDSKYKQFQYTVSKHNNITIHRVPIISRGNKSHLRIFLNYLSFILGSFFFKNRVFKSKFDIVFIYATSPILQAIPAILLKKRLNCPIVLWVQDLWPESVFETNYIKNKFILNFLSKIVKFIYDRADFIFIQSYKFKKSILKFNNNFENKIWEYENPAENFLNINMSSNKINKKTISYFGNIGHAQDINVFIELGKFFKKNGDKFILNIYGNGSEKITLKKAIESCNLKRQIQLFDHMAPEKLYCLIAKSEYLIITLKGSEAFSRTLPGKFQTCLYFGKPLLVVAKGILPEFIKKFKLGLFVAPYKYEELYKKLKTLDSDKKKKTFYSNNCIKLYNHKYKLNFKVKSLLNKFIEII